MDSIFFAIRWPNFCPLENFCKYLIFFLQNIDSKKATIQIRTYLIKKDQSALGINTTFFRPIRRCLQSWRTFWIQTPLPRPGPTHLTSEIQFLVNKQWNLQCCGSWMFIPDPNFYPSRVPDLGSRISDPGSRIPGPKTAAQERGEKICCHTFFL